MKNLGPFCLQPFEKHDEVPFKHVIQLKVFSCVFRTLPSISDGTFCEFFASTFPVDTGRKLDVHKTSSERLRYVQFTSCVYGVIKRVTPTEVTATVLEPTTT